MQEPMAKFQQWWREALQDSPLKQKSAVCVSTLDDLGYPASRFVDLKAVDERGLVFCSYLNSNKGKQISADPKVALTAWWDHMGYQIRVLGDATEISLQDAQSYWQSRHRAAQITTCAFVQSQPLEHEAELERRSALYGLTAPEVITKPENWGGYRINPVSIEFLTFRDSRLHLREYYQKQDEQWCKTLLQP